MLKLSIREATLFEQIAGKPWQRVQRRLMTSVCQTHLRAMQHCSECDGTRPCESHVFAMEDCGKCRGPDLMALEWAALHLVIRRRTDPKAEFDEDADIGEAMAAVGEVMSSPAEEPAASSPESSKNGSRPSSTGSGSPSPSTKGSRRTAGSE